MEVKGFLEFIDRRLIKTIFFSWKGLRVAFLGQEAFRCEVLLFLSSLPIAIWVAQTRLQLMLLVAVGLIVLIIELLNTGIELVINRIGLELNELSGQAKDVGSAAVFLALILFIMVWVTIIFENVRFAG
jgi:diacylglycerol kinase (ATP)